MYIDELREKYCEHMTKYRKFIKSLSKKVIQQPEVFFPIILVTNF